MHTVFALLCFVVVIHWLISPYPSGLLHWHCGNLTIAPVPAKQPWWIWINTSCEFIMNDCITTTQQSTSKPCAYFLGYTVCSNCSTNSNPLPHTAFFFIKCNSFPKLHENIIEICYPIIVPGAWSKSKQPMMTSSNGNIFRVTGHLCGEFTGPRWISRTKASDAELSCFLWSAPE